MLQHERLQRIQTWLLERDFLTIDDAVTRLKASPATVRRDFTAVAKLGVARRTHGGLMRELGAVTSMPPFAARETQQASEKARLARAAAELLRPGQTVLIDGGTSTLALADHLAERQVTVITNSLRLATALAERPDYERHVAIHLTGGYLLPQSGMLIGPQARATMACYHGDWAFLSVGGIGPDGLYNTTELAVEVEQAMIAHAQRVCILADHTKIGRRSMCRLGNLDLADLLLTNYHPENAAAIAAMRALGLEVIEVDAPTTPQADTTAAGQ